MAHPGRADEDEVEHIVPLSRQAIAALRELETLTEGRRYVFANQVNHDKPMSENTLL